MANTLIVVFIALVAYLASQVSLYSQKALALDRDNQTLREQQAGLTRQIASLQPMMQAPPAPVGEQPQARPGETTTPMHQEGK